VLAVGLFPTDRPDAFGKAFARFIGRFLSCLLHITESQNGRGWKGEEKEIKAQFY